MIITEKIMYKGEIRDISVLKDTSNFKVDVKCPVCSSVRKVTYKSVKLAGHSICLKCIRKEKQRKYLDIGSIYGKLKIIGHSDKSGYSICECECGNELVIYNYNLETGKTKSCGCLKELNFINSEKVRGEHHGRWKGGVSSESSIVRNSNEYKEWRISVFERDNYICQCCRVQGGKLNAHHIKNFAEKIELRTVIDNGITLCEECHIGFHSEYGRKNNNKTQLEKYIINYNTNIKKEQKNETIQKYKRNARKSS